jgi:hypothetical protein
MKFPEQTTLQALRSLILASSQDKDHKLDLDQFNKLADEANENYGLSEKDMAFLFDIISLEEQTNKATIKNAAEAQKIINKLKNK